MENRGDQSHRRPLCEAGIAGVVLAGFVAWQYFQFSQIERSTDYTAIFRPILQFFFETLRGGEIPLWNPYIGLGRPILTDIHLGFLYPPTYLLALGERLGLFLLIWLHYLLLCLGTSGLARHFGARQPWALLAGLVVCVAGNYNGRMLSGMIYYVFQQCYAPLLLLLTCRLGATWDWRRVIRLGAVTTAMFLCGNANVFYLIELGLAVYLGAFAWFEFKTYRWRGTGVLFGQFAAALIVAIALSSFAWQPYLDLVENGNRARSDFDFSAFFSADALHLYGIVAAIPDNWELNFHQGPSFAPIRQPCGRP